MRSRFPSSRRDVSLALLTALVLSIGTTATAAAARKPKPTPPPPSPTVTVAVNPSGMVEPNGQYVSVDVTVTCPIGWTWDYGRLYVLRGDQGGAGTFTASCTGTAQVARARVVNGMGFELGDWTATAYVGIQKSGQNATATSTRTVRLEPTVTARIADQGQLTGSSGTGVQIAVDVACTEGATGVNSGLTVSQNGTAQGSATFTPICDGTAHTFVLSITASRGTFHTGSAMADAFPITDWNGQGFYGFDSRTVTLLESSAGDTTPPSTPGGLNANVFGDGETWLDWAASTDNATASGLIVYEVFLNGTFDQGIGGGETRAILYAELGIVNTIEVVAIDGAGNRSAPATVTVDCSHTWGCQ
jgi:hypothetical protein